MLNSFSAWLLVEPYLAHLRLKNCSPGTLREYRKVLWNYMLESGQFGLEVDVEDLRAWLAGLYDRGLKPGTIGSRVTILRAFWNFAVAEGKALGNPVARLPKVKVPKRLPKALTEAEVEAFFEAILEASSRRADRDLLLFSLLYSCGLRVSEVVQIRIEHVDLVEGSIRVVGKGNKERRLYLQEELAALLGAWIGERDRGWLFPGEEGHLGTRVVQQYCREYGEAAGIPRKVHPHMLRHTCATHYLLKGAPITFVQGLLGHANLATTGIYTQVTDAEAARIVRSVKLLPEGDHV